MTEYAVAVTVIVMAGLLLTAVAWQVLAVARDRSRHATDLSQETAPIVHDLLRRIEALERKTGAS